MLWSGVSNKSLKMVLTKPCIFKISALCPASQSGWVGSGVENDNSTKIGKGRNQFNGNCLVISLLKPKLNHVDTEYVERFFSFREKEIHCNKKSNSLIEWWQECLLSFLCVNTVPSHQIIQLVNKNKFLETAHYLSPPNEQQSAQSTLGGPRGDGFTRWLAQLQATWVPSGPQTKVSIFSTPWWCGEELSLCLPHLTHKPEVSSSHTLPEFLHLLCHPARTRVYIWKSPSKLGDRVSLGKPFAFLLPLYCLGKRPKCAFVYW